MGQWCPGHIGSSVPSGIWFHPVGQASDDRKPMCRNSHWQHLANAWPLEVCEGEEKSDNGDYNGYLNIMQ